MIQLTTTSFHYQKHKVIKDLSCSIKSNTITAIVGPNGAGKSTLLKLIGKLIKPSTGEVQFNGQNLKTIKPKTYAKQLSFLMQHPALPEGFTVEQVVMLGRIPYLGLLGKPSSTDHDKVSLAIKEVGLEQYKQKLLAELSGGQQQRAWIAMAIAQDTPYILLDEPTTFLDLSHQIKLLNLLKELKEKHQKTIIMVIHDLNLASYYADEVIVLNKGELVTQGNAEIVLTEALMSEIFNLKSTLHHCKKTNTRTFIPAIAC